MIPTNVNIWTHYLIDLCLEENGYAIDLTAGNGNDTSYLAQRSKHVFAFDIQNEAIINTKKRLKKDHLYDKCSLIQACHSRVLDFVDKEVDCIVMNLGYLPKGDKTIVTKWNTTKVAIRDGLSILKKGGLFFIAVYKAHLGAEEEVMGMKNLITSLDQKEFGVNRISFPNQKNSPPELFIIERKNQ